MSNIANKSQSIVDNAQELLVSRGMMNKRSVRAAGESVHHDDSVLSYYQYVRHYSAVHSKPDNLIPYELFNRPNVAMTVMDFDQHYQDVDVAIERVDNDSFSVAVNKDGNHCQFVAGFHNNKLVVDSKAPAGFSDFTKKDNFDGILSNENIECGIILSIRFKSWCLHTETGQDFMSTLGINEPELEIPVYEPAL